MLDEFIAYIVKNEIPLRMVRPKIRSFELELTEVTDITSGGFFSAIKKSFDD